jgi:hypothetical protein
MTFQNRHVGRASEIVREGSLHPHFIGLRTGDALIRFFGRSAFGGPDAVAVHNFAGADPARMESDWRALVRDRPRPPVRRDTSVAARPHLGDHVQWPAMLWLTLY